MTRYFIIPGLGNSGPEHWQTYFEKSGNTFQRINQHECDVSTYDDWVTTINNTIASHDSSTIVLIGHSLGCTAIAQWAWRYIQKIKGAQLVAPNDIENSIYTFDAKGFAPIPKTKVDFKTIIVACADDPWVSPERARFFAHTWGSEFIDIGNAGHIHASSGNGEWKHGLEILKMLE